MRKSNIIFVFFSFILLTFFTKELVGGNDKIASSAENNSGTPHSHFGWSVSLSGNAGIITAPHETTVKGVNAGTAFIYDLSSNPPSMRQQLIPSDGEAFENFGYAASIDSTVAIVSAIGSREKGPYSGSVYIYRYNGSMWIEEAKLTASDGKPGDFFGQSVAVKGNLAIIGAYQSEGKTVKTGAAYIFRFKGNKWIEEAKIYSNDGTPNSYFGFSVALGKDGTAIVGAYGADGKSSKSGAAYTFELIGGEWKQTGKLISPDGETGDKYGYSVAIHKDLAIVGAYHKKVSSNNFGAAYIYKRRGETWKEEVRLKQSTGTKHDYFGVSVDIRDAAALIGSSRFDKETLKEVGAIYVFLKSPDGWYESKRIQPHDGNSYDNFGLSLSLDRGKALVGSRLNDNQAEDAGAAYFYDIYEGTVDEIEETIPKEFALSQNYPNPFNPATMIRYSVPRESFVSLIVYDILGQEMKRLVYSVHQPGSYKVEFNAKPYASGIYMFRMQAGDFTETKKMSLTK